MVTTGEASKLSPIVREHVIDLLTDALFAREMAANPSILDNGEWDEAKDYIAISKERGIEIRY